VSRVAVGDVTHDSKATFDLKKDTFYGIVGLTVMFVVVEQVGSAGFSVR
jgi:hypothetical protein